MADCKYYSFYALAKINDPELLYEAFQQQIAPGHADKVEIEVYVHSDARWNRLTRTAALDQNIAVPVLVTLQQKFEAEDAGDWYFEADCWYCSYKPLSSKQFVLSIKSSLPDILIEEEYLQFLFHFYCHQLQMLQGTYRDALTGLYNRRAFNEKIPQLLGNAPDQKRRSINFTPSTYVMVDIDHFKRINDSMGHLYGDEVLLMMAQLMIDSFRENDLLFRYGGEEFAMVLMDISPQQAMESLERFRQKIENHCFPGEQKLTLSIGFTLFDKSLTIDEIIAQADSALYYGKSTTRNVVNSYQEIVENGLMAMAKIPQPPGLKVN